MIELRDRLQELADAAAREAVTRGPGAALGRGRRRRRHLAVGVASVLAVALVATAGVADRLGGAPASPSLDGQRPTGPPAAAPSPEEQAFQDLARELRHCPVGASYEAEVVAMVRSRKWRHFWIAAATPPAPGDVRFCWTDGLFALGGGGGYGGVREAKSGAVPLTASGTTTTTRFATVEGQVTKRAVLVRVRFRDGRPPLDVKVIEAGPRYPVNFYAAFFPGDGSEDEKHWPPSEVTALDAKGKQVARCTLEGPYDAPGHCPGN